ncbi:LysR substrate-binding domain-containing protein [Enterobacter hormaechei]|nr:LysR substrate-binding domain-containing protein [Enterobacter hormaechei]EGK60374.1 LysR family transcriptional regulator [Enterobacter hormaechei ATCC 49162]
MAIWVNDLLSFMVVARERSLGYLSRRSVTRCAIWKRGRVDGQLILNSLPQRIDAAENGLGLAYVPEDSIFDALAEGRLVRVPEAWCPAFTGYHLFYPSRRQHTTAFAFLIAALRHS